jgi:hypothetical protein
MAYNDAVEVKKSSALAAYAMAYWPYDQAFKQWQANRSGNTTPYHLPFVEIRKNGEDYVRIESRYARIISDGLKTKRT